MRPAVIAMVMSFIAFGVLAAVLLLKLAMDNPPEQAQFDPDGIDEFMDELRKLFDETEK